MGKQFDKTLAVMDSVIPAAAVAPYLAVDKDGAVIGTAGVFPWGIVPWGGNADVPMSIVIAGTVPITLAASLSRGDLACVDNAGKAVGGSATHIYCFRLLEDGNSGEVVEAQFGYFGEHD